MDRAGSYLKGEISPVSPFSIIQFVRSWAWACDGWRSKVRLLILVDPGGEWQLWRPVGHFFDPWIYTDRADLPTGRCLSHVDTSPMGPFRYRKDLL